MLLFYILPKKRGLIVNVCLEYNLEEAGTFLIFEITGNRSCGSCWVIKRDFNTVYLSPVLVSLLMCFGQSMHPCIPPCPSFFPSYPSSVSPPTGNRWEVKGVTCRGSGLLPLACQSLITHIHTHNSAYPRGGGETQLGAITGAVRAHTQISIHEHTCSPVADESDTQPPLTLFVSLLIIISTPSYYAHYFFKSSDISVIQKTLTPVIQQLSVISSRS